MMRILYISYTKPGTGARIHTLEFFSAFRRIHPNAMLFPGALSVQISRSNDNPQFDSIHVSPAILGLRMIMGMFTKKCLSEITIIRKYRPDVLILRPGHYVSGLFLGRLYRIPLILEVNGPMIESGLTKAPLVGLRLWEWLEKYVFLKMPNRITVVSESLRKYFISRGIPASKIGTIPNGVNIEKFSPSIEGEEVRKRYGLQDKTVLGFSGTFAPWHGIDFLLEAVTHLIKKNMPVKDNWALLLIGRPGPYFVMPDLPRGYVVPTGHVSYDDMPAHLAAIDVFIAPYPPIDPFYFSPLKLFEAMAMGKAVLASAQGQICELIEDGINGLLYPPGDMSGLLNKLNILLEDEQLRERLGMAARLKMVRNYTWENNANKVLRLCEQLWRGVSH